MSDPRRGPGPMDDDDPGDELRRLFGSPAPLDAPSGTFERISRNARRRRRTRQATATLGATFGLLAMLFAGVAVRHSLTDHGHSTSTTTILPGAGSSSPTTGSTAGEGERTSGPPHPSGTPRGFSSLPANPPQPGKASTPAVPECTGHLTANLVGGASSPSRVGLVVTLQNVSQQTCRVYGYPGVSFGNSQDPTADTVAAQRTIARQLYQNTVGAGGQSVPVTLAPNEFASAGIEWQPGTADATTGTLPPGCESYTYVAVTPPDTQLTTVLTMPTPETVCDAAGTLSVTTLVPGKDGPAVISSSG
jgi:hypothetical protein